MDTSKKDSPSPLQQGVDALRRGFLNYLHSGQPGRSTPELLYINAFTLIGTANVFSGILIEHTIGNDRMAGFLAVISVLTILNVILLRKTLNASLAATVILVTMLVMLTAMLIDGMFQNTAIIWCATFPALAFFFKGKIKGVIWLSALLGVLLGLMLLQYLNLLHTPYSSPALALVIASTATVGMMVFIYESIRSKAVASLHQIREELQYLAHSDPLTGLPNRTAFYSHLPQMLAQANRDNTHLAVLFIDLDDFKPINDTFGHEAGDEMLRQASTRLRALLRESDFVARFGGDEFVAVLPRIGRERDVGVVADKIIDSLSVPFTIQDYCCKIGVSIGITLYPNCADSIDSLLRLADHAMYAAKQGGKTVIPSARLGSVRQQATTRARFPVTRPASPGTGTASPSSLSGLHRANRNAL